MSAVHDGYCLICQEAHTFRQDCLKSVVCKGCGQTGHLKIHCSARDKAGAELSSAATGSKKNSHADGFGIMQTLSTSPSSHSRSRSPGRRSRSPAPSGTDKGGGSPDASRNVSSAKSNDTDLRARLIQLRKEKEREHKERQRESDGDWHCGDQDYGYRTDLRARLIQLSEERERDQEGVQHESDGDWHCGDQDYRYTTDLRARLILLGEERLREQEKRQHESFESDLKDCHNFNSSTGEENSALNGEEEKPPIKHGKEVDDECSKDSSECRPDKLIKIGELGQERYPQVNLLFLERKSRKRKRKRSVERSICVDYSQNGDSEESKLGEAADFPILSPSRKRRKISVTSNTLEETVSTAECETSPISMFMKGTAGRKAADDRLDANGNYDYKVKALTSKVRALIHQDEGETINLSREKGPAKIYKETAPSKQTNSSIQQFSSITSPIEFRALTSESTPPVLEKQCSQTLSSSLNYQVVCVHLETFKSSSSPLTKLTQLGCSSVWFRGGTSKRNDFFRAIKPSGLENILDDYTIGGDLLQALHMTREDDGTFLFRGRFEEKDPGKTVVCCSEESALGDFLAHLASLYKMNENVVLVSVDEESLAILVEKLTALSNEFREKVVGFTDWKRVSRLLVFQSTVGEELEEFVNKRKVVLNSVRPREFLNAKDVSELLRVSLMIRSSSQDGLQLKGQKNRGKRLSSLVSSTCQTLRDLPKPKEANPESEIEDYLEVTNNFRSSVRTTMSIKLKEVIQLCSDSEEEFIADELKLITHGMKEFERETVVLCSDSDEAVAVLSPTLAPHQSIDVDRGGHEAGRVTPAHRLRDVSDDNVTAQQNSQPQAATRSGEKPDFICHNMNYCQMKDKACVSRVKPVYMKIHMNQMHKEQKQPSQTSLDNSPGPTSKSFKLIQCPRCKNKVKPNNIQTHLMKVHKVDIDNIEDKLLINCCQELKIYVEERKKNRPISHPKSNSPKPKLTGMSNSVQSKEPSHSTTNNSNTNPNQRVKRKKGLLLGPRPPLNYRPPVIPPYGPMFGPRRFPSAPPYSPWPARISFGPWSRCRAPWK